MIPIWWISKTDGSYKTYFELAPNPLPYFYFNGNGSESSVLPVYGTPTYFRINFQNFGKSTNDYMIDLKLPYVTNSIKFYIDLLFMEAVILLGNESNTYKVIWADDNSLQYEYVEGSEIYSAVLRFRLEEIIL